MDLTAAFNLPPEEAIEYFRKKGYQITFDWHEMQREAHAKAFTVSRVASMDILQDIRDYTDRALAEGWSLNRYKNELGSVLRQRGWWGKQEVVDERTGEVKQTKFNPSRLETIYRNNLQSAYAAGDYKQSIEVAKDRPYWRYNAVNDGRTRPVHRGWDDIILRYDDPWWDTHHPPNGWNCRCWKTTLSQRQIDKKGLKVLKGEDLDRRFPPVDWTDPATGLTRKVPVGIDPGWDYNPGKNKFHNWDTLGHLPDCFSVDFAENIPCAKIVEGQKTWKDYKRPDIKTVDNDDMMLSAPAMLGRASDRLGALKTIALALGVSKENPFRYIKSPIETVLINYEHLPHIVEKTDNARERYSNFIIPTLTDPFEIYATKYTDNSIRNRYIALFKGTKYDILAIVRINKDGSLFWNMMNVELKKLNKQRIGELLYGK